MKFNKQDRQEYITFLKREIRKEKRQPESIAKYFNIENLSKDLNNLTNEN